MYPGKFHERQIFRKNEITWGEHFLNHNFSSARVGKIFHMRVQGISFPEPMVRISPNAGLRNITAQDLRLHTR